MDGKCGEMSLDAPSWFWMSYEIKCINVFRILKLIGDAFNIDGIIRGRQCRLEWMRDVEKYRLTYHHVAGCFMKLYVNVLSE